MEPDVIRIYSSSPPPMEETAEEEEEDDFGDFGTFSTSGSSNNVQHSISFTEFDTPTTFNQSTALSATSPPEILNNNNRHGVTNGTATRGSNGTGGNTHGGPQGNSELLPKANGVLPSDRSDVKKSLANSVEFSKDPSSECNGSSGGFVSETLTNGFASFDVQNSTHSHTKGTAIDETVGSIEDDFADFAAFSNAEENVNETANDNFLSDESCDKNVAQNETTTTTTTATSQDNTNNTGQAETPASDSSTGVAPDDEGLSDRDSDSHTHSPQRDVALALALEHSGCEAVCAKEAVAMNGLDDDDTKDSENEQLSPADEEEGNLDGKVSGNDTETETETETSLGRPLSTDALEEFCDISTTGSFPSPQLQGETATPETATPETATPLDTSLPHDNDQQDQEGFDGDFGDFADPGSFATASQGFADFDQSEQSRSRSPTLAQEAINDNASSHSEPKQQEEVEASTSPNGKDNDKDDFGEFNLPKFQSEGIGNEGQEDTDKFPEFPGSESLGIFSEEVNNTSQESNPNPDSNPSPDPKEDIDIEEDFGDFNAPTFQSGGGIGSEGEEKDSFPEFPVSSDSLGNSLQEANPNHDTNREASPSHDTNREANPSHDTNREASPSHDTNREASPSHDTNREASPSPSTKDIDNEEDDFGDFNSPKFQNSEIGNEGEDQDSFPEFPVSDSFGDFSQEFEPNLHHKPEALNTNPDPKDIDNVEEDFGDFNSPKFQNSESGTDGEDGGSFAAFPVSDSFGNFSSAAAEGLEGEGEGEGEGGTDAGWNAFGEQGDGEGDGEGWAAFSTEQNINTAAAAATAKDTTEQEEWHQSEPQDTNKEVSRTDTQSAALSSRLEKLFQVSFPQSVAVTTEQEVTSLKHILEPPRANQEEETRSPGNRCVYGSVWLQLQDIHEAFGLRYQWGGSYCNKALLCCLGIDTRNILFTGQKKQPVIVPMYAASLGMLEPTKEPVKPVSAAELITSIAQTPPVAPQRNTNPPDTDTVTESLPPVQFDWSSSGLTNPLDASGGSSLLNLDFFGPVEDSGSSSSPSIPGVDPELYELTTAKLEGGSGSRVADAFARLMSTMEKTSTATRKPRREENLSSEASAVILSLPDLSFMTAKVLMFPATLTPLCSQATPD